MTRPAMLYLVPHDIHRDMAEQINAELLETETGGVLARAKSALNRDLSDRTVILEGGVPLSEAFVMKLTSKADKTIMLAADETLQNQATPLPYYSTTERIIHNIAIRSLDGIIAPSPEIKAWAEDRTNAAVELAYPYVLPDRFDSMSEISPDHESNRGLYIGSDRPSNNIGLLQAAAELSDVEIDVVGHETGSHDDTDEISYHGFVSDEKLYDLMNNCSFVTFPATAGAHPMVTIEAMVAGLAPVTTYGVGTASHVQKIHPRLLHRPSAEELADAIQWWTMLQTDTKMCIASRAREVGTKFDPETGRATFRQAYERIMRSI